MKPTLLEKTFYTSVDLGRPESSMETWKNGPVPVLTRVSGEGIPVFAKTGGVTSTSLCCVPSFRRLSKTSRTWVEESSTSSTSTTDHPWFYTITESWTTIYQNEAPITTASTTSTSSTTSSSVSSTSTTFTTSSSIFSSTSTSTATVSTTTGAPVATFSTDPQDKLSNGATAGIVIAVVALLLSLIFLGRYIYKRKRRLRRFSPPSEAYRDTHVSPQLDQWLVQHGGHHPVSPTRSGPGVGGIEMKRFIRPERGAKLRDPGVGGIAEVHGESSSTSDGQGQPHPGEHVRSSVQAGAQGTEERAGALPWDESYQERYRAW